MIKMIFKIPKDMVLDDEVMSLLDTFEVDFNYFTMDVPENKLKDVEELIKHYNLKQAN